MKNNLYYSGDKELYKIYRNKILTLSRQSKQLYYYAYFNENLRNMKKIWAALNLLINRTKKNSKPISLILFADGNKYINDPTKISDVLNIYFSSVGRKLASIIPPTTRHFTEYLSGNYCKSFFFQSSDCPRNSFHFSKQSTWIILLPNQNLMLC